MSQGPVVSVIAYTTFAGPPAGCTPGADQDHGSEMARLIECAGRTCYDSYGKGRSSTAFHQHLQEVQHLSVIEHASLSFYISGISRGCSHELVRHRVGIAISQRSTRYVDESESEWCWHPALQGLPADDEAGLSRSDLDAIEAACRDTYGDIVRALEPRIGRKQARGAARGALGNALETRLVMTANLRALRHFIALRATDAADAEIRLLANALHAAALPFCPEWLTYETQPAADGFGWVLKP
jgi:thymidylate synthase (FAD)